MHITEGEMRAYLDRQLEMAAARRVDAHLAACPQCQAKAAQIRSQAERVQARLLGQSPTAPHLNPAAARRLFDERLRQEIETQEKPSMMQKFFGKFSRPVWAGIALIAVLAVALAFPQVRAAADSFLQLFRVEQVRLLPVDMQSLSTEMQSSKQLEAMFTENVQVEEKGKRSEFASFDEAAAAAGFPLRRLAGVEGSTRFMVDPGASMTFKVNLEMARSALREMGRDDIQLPDSLDGAVVKVDASSAVVQMVGDCAEMNHSRTDPDEPEQAPQGDISCTTLTQSPSPQVSAPPEMDLNQIGKIYLQVLGMSAEEAETYAGSVNWATTLVMPVPQGRGGEYEEVSVNGVQGVFARTGYGSSRDYALMWVQDGIVYVLTGSGMKTDALTLAGSLQ